MDLAFRSDGNQLASASADGTVKLWDVSGDIPAGVATLRGHLGEVSRVRYLPGGEMLASAGADGSARLWWLGEEPDAQSDLFAYLEREFFEFDPDSNELSWAGGSGFLRVPAESLTGLWRDERGGAAAVRVGTPPPLFPRPEHGAANAVKTVRPHRLLRPHGAAAPA